MMGKQSPLQGKLFYSNINIDKRVRENHPLRKIDAMIDFDFVYDEVEGSYGTNGNESVPPPIILKLMLLLVFYNVRSERELMATVPERNDWLWFLGYDFDTAIPDHSVLSKARTRWGVSVFKSFFERIVLQCCDAGLVDGSKLFVDSSLIDADASNNSVVDTHSLKRHMKKSYRELERRLEESADRGDVGEGGEGVIEGERKGAVNSRYISTSDPDAAIVNRGKKSRLTYQTHRAVDGACEIITAAEVTPGDVNEAHKLTSLVDSHHQNTGRNPEIVVADSKYGTIENYLTCHDRRIKAHMTDLNKYQDNKGGKAGIFPAERFEYDRENDCYICPAGERLRPLKLKKKRASMDYTISKKLCNACSLKPQCTRSKTGRTIKRHFQQDELDQMREASRSSAARRDIKTRQHLMERSFARATRYGYKRARWRRLWRVQIQEYLTTAIQNIEVLIRKGEKLKKAAAMLVEVERMAWKTSIQLKSGFCSLFRTRLMYGIPAKGC